MKWIIIIIIIIIHTLFAQDDGKYLLLQML